MINSVNVKIARAGLRVAKIKNLVVKKRNVINKIDRQFFAGIFMHFMLARIGKILLVCAYQV